MHMSPGLLVASENGRGPLAPARHSAAAASSVSSVAPSVARVVGRWGLAVALALAAWAGTVVLHSAHARELSWSIGVQAPGAVVQLANTPPPMVVVRPPAYVAAPVYSAAPVYAPPPQVVWVDQWGNPVRQVMPPPPSRHWGDERWRHHRHHHGQGHAYGHRDHDRW